MRAPLKLALPNRVTLLGIIKSPVSQVSTSVSPFVVYKDLPTILKLLFSSWIVTSFSDQHCIITEPSIWVTDDFKELKLVIWLFKELKLSESPESVIKFEFFEMASVSTPEFFSYLGSCFRFPLSGMKAFLVVSCNELFSYFVSISLLAVMCTNVYLLTAAWNEE